MALSPFSSKSLHHGRSLSLPSQSNPAVSRFHDVLTTLTSSDQASSSSLASMGFRINGLIELYNTIDGLVVQPHNQHIISEPILDDYMRLLDVCSRVTDLISLTKQHLRELLSSLRRKDDNGIHRYLISRNKSKKMIQLCLKDLRSSRSNTAEKTGLVRMVKEAESAAFGLMESLMSYIVGQERKSGGWSSLSKLFLHSKKGAISHSSSVNEFDRVDSLLQLSQEKELVSHLKEMDSSIDDVEQKLELLFRQLIKTRVSQLNILNH